MSTGYRFALCGILLGVFSSHASAVDIIAVPVDATVPHLFSGGEMVLLEPGGRVTIEFYLSNWDPSLLGATRLHLFQVSVNTTGFESGPIGRIAPPLIGCVNNAQCQTAFETPARCVNLISPNVCTPAFQDRVRSDWMFNCCTNIAEVSQFNPSRQIIFGGLGLTLEGVIDNGDPRYIGTLVVDASASASGSYEIQASGNPQSTFFLTPQGSALPIGSIVPARIFVSTPQACCGGEFCSEATPDECGDLGGSTLHGGHCGDAAGAPLPVCDQDCNHNGVYDPAELSEGRAKDCDVNGILDECEDGAPQGLLLSSVPAENQSLPKINRNAIELRFECAIERPPLDAIKVQELQPGGAFGPDLLGAGGFSFDVVEDQGVPRLLQLTESGTVSAFQSGKWYAVRMPSRWRGIGPFELHFPALVGDASGDGLAVNRDVLLINSSLGQVVSRFDRRDINGDNAITNFDVTIANSAVPARMPPKPSGH